jgi:hypothetical protein
MIRRLPRAVKDDDLGKVEPGDAREIDGAIARTHASPVAIAG